MNKSEIKLVFTVGAMAMLTTHANAALYDAAADFQIVSNPGAVWSYGYSAAGGDAYSLILFDDHVGTNAWTKSNYILLGAPVAWKNTTGGTIDGVAPGQISLHPGPAADGDFAVLRFSSPRTATYEIAGQFYAGDGGSMSGSIVRDGAFDHPLQFFATTTNASFFSISHTSLVAGQTLDFVVGNNGSFFSGNTPLAVRITDAAVVPESEIYAMFLTGIWVLGFMANRRLAG